MSFMRVASSIIPNTIGRIMLFIRPANIKSKMGILIKIVPRDVKIIKTMHHNFSFRAISGKSVLINDIAIYEFPTTEVIDAKKSTSPKMK